MKRDRLKIPVDKLDTPVEIEGTLRAAEADLEPPDITLNVQFRAVKCGGEALVEGKVRASFIGECAMCLRPARLEINESFSSACRLGQVSEIDVLPDIRDAFIAGVPMQLKCSLGCKGLCPNCGQTLNDGPCGCPATPSRSKGTRLGDGTSLKVALNEALEKARRSKGA